MSAPDPIRAVLSRPLPSGQPLPDGETAADWAGEALCALDLLDARGDPVAADGKALRDHLRALATGPLEPGLDRAPGRTRLLGEVVRNLASPGRINQGHKGTCAVTCVEATLAERDPAEYARILAGLCAPEGGVVLRGGARLVRDESALEWAEAEARRSPVSRLFQVAAMELAYPDLDYQNLADGYRPERPDTGEGGDPGVGLDAFDALLEALTGERWDTLSDQKSHVARLLAKMGVDTGALPDLYRDGPGILRRAADAGEISYVTIDLPEARGATGAGDDFLALGQLLSLPHKVRVLSVTDETVIFDDPLDPTEPWIPMVASTVLDRTGRCAMGRSDFVRLVVEVSYLPRFWGG